MRVYASSGGGVRIGASFGAILEGERQGRFRADQFDWYVGTSAGTLDAALTANGWTGEQKMAMFLGTDFGRLFRPFLMPFGMRKALAVLAPISMGELSDFIDSLQMSNPYGPPVRDTFRLLINAVDAEANVQVVFCQKKPDWLTPSKRLQIQENAFYGSLGDVLTRSMVLPGLRADHPKWQDGGVAENPLLSALPKDAAITLVHLGYAGLVHKKGDTIPKTVLDQAMYDYEFKAYSFAEYLMAELPNLTFIRPEIYDVDSANFALSRQAKEEMILRAMANTRTQWAALPRF